MKYALIPALEVVEKWVQLMDLDHPDINRMVAEASCEERQQGLRFLLEIYHTNRGTGYE